MSDKLTQAQLDNLIAALNAADAGANWQDATENANWTQSISNGAEVLLVKVYRGTPTGDRFNAAGWLGNDLIIHRTRYGGEDNIPEITVAEKRGEVALAKEIVRRVLPTLREVKARCETRKAASDAYKNRTRECVEQLAAAFGFDTPKEGTEKLSLSGFAAKATDYRGVAFDRTWYGTAEASAYEGGTATIELRNVPLDLALKVAALLREAGVRNK